MANNEKHRKITRRRTDAEIAEGAELVPPSAVATHIGVTPKTIINRTESGDIPFAIKLGRTYRYRLADVLKALGKGGAE